MTRKEFIDRINEAVDRYLDDFEEFEPDPQLSVNPVTLYVDVVSGKIMQEGLADSEEAVEDAVAAQGDESEQDTDYQVKENPDYYPIRQFLKVSKDHPTVADPMAIGRLASRYIK